MRTTFAETILERARSDKRIILLSADLGFKVFDEFRSELPGQFVNVGVAEQNMISVAAGLAMCGKKVYCYSMVPFLVMRAFEQIRVDVCNHNLAVTLVGVGGGLSYGMEGMTHHGFEDIAIMRSLPGMSVAAPGDPVECAAIVNESVEYKGPLFIRLGKNNDPHINKPDTKIKIGRGVTVKEGADTCLLVTGSMLPLGVELAKDLNTNGIDAALVSMHTVKPLDGELLKRISREHKHIFAIEEHSVIGGLGSAVAEFLLGADYKGNFKSFGLPDRYCSNIGNHEFLKAESGLTVPCLSKKIGSFLK